ncbi:NTP transferase domain-containing protein [Benzoatithermus flavus]|uniref:Molybdopterin-binding/glycosyltransferase family 2 protein n=1 Tax=Benzoatithermus flavus TaxID=3108223 RepID=A0ABU8XNK0_9PROT
MRFDRFALDAAEGAVLAHAVRADGILLKKGHRLSAEDIGRLRTAGVESVMAVRFDPEDVPEDEAAARLAGPAAGACIDVAPAFTGRANLHGSARGVLVVDVERVHRFNEIDEAITFATLPAYAVVEPKQMVATVKIIPFAVRKDFVERALAMLEEGPLVRVAPFRPWRAWLIQTELPSVAQKVLDKTVRVTRERVEHVGGELSGETRCPHEPEALAAAIRKAEASGCDMFLIAGASAITDRGDVLPAGIERAGGRILHFGMPVDPGNLLLLARLGERPVLGLPGCCRSPKLNGFDWVLERLAAGIEVTGRDIMRMGVGGLLMEIESRPQPREGGDRLAGPPKVAAVVLAAGQSRRMGGPNKLLLPIAGKPMVRHVVEAAVASRAAPVIVVLGHQQHEIRQALRGLKVQFVHNPDHAEGLSTSLKAGLAAVPAEADGAVVCLGDMPRVSAGLIDRLIGAFNPIERRAIVVPTRHGKRGNPVLWGRAYFPEMQAVAGDVGARHLIGRHADAVAEVETEDDAALLDIDTPEALAAFAGAQP